VTAGYAGANGAGAAGALGSVGAGAPRAEAVAITAGPDAHRGWFPADAERHRRDAPRFCPACAAALALTDGGQGLVTEYWTGKDRVFVCFCGACGWSGDIVLAERVIGQEAAG
jgi:hypothetical protein